MREEVRIPANGYTLAATILRPEGPGPFGAVVLNHGYPGTEEERAAESWRVFASSAPVFARRGYVVVMPLRRGFGATGGEAAEDPGTCWWPDFRGGESEASEDIMAAWRYTRALPYVDGGRMLLAGQSAGAMASLYTAGMRHPEGLQAVLAFAAGRGGVPGGDGTPCAVEALAKVFKDLGERLRVPVLLNYAENDRLFGPKTQRYWYERLAQGGADVQYVLQPPYGRNGHYLFTQLVGVEHWLPTVERFLERHAIPFARLDEDDPRAQPLLGAQLPASVRDQPGGSCQAIYRLFLESPGPRAYTVSEDGHCGFAGGMANALERALDGCERVAGTACQPYAVDEKVVWEGRSGSTVVTELRVPGARTQ